MLKLMYRGLGTVLREIAILGTTQTLIMCGSGKGEVGPKDGP